jgi:alkane 1-monooxygenase
MANRKYQTLRHFDESPQMPTGYPGMMLLALVPPLWFYIMDREIEKYKQGQAGAYLA